MKCSWTRGWASSHLWTGGRLVGGQVVADHVDGQAGLDLAVDVVEEVAEVYGPVLGGQLADDLAGGGVQRGEQVDRAVADVVVAAALRHPWQHGQNRGSSLQGLDLRLLVDREDRGVRRRREVKADDVADLVEKQRVGRDLEALRAVRLQPEGPPDAVHAASARSRPAWPAPAWTSAWRPREPLPGSGPPPPRPGRR